MDEEQRTEALIDLFVGRGRILQEPDEARLTPGRMMLAGIRRKWTTAKWDHYPDNIRVALMNYAGELNERRKDGQGLFLHGPTSKGKTFAAALITKEIIKRDGFPIMVYAPDISQITVEDPDKLRKMRTCAFLVVDDLGAGAGGSSTRAMQEDLIRRREADMLPCIITSNLTKKKLSDAYGEQFVGIISRSCTPIMFG